MFVFIWIEAVSHLKVNVVKSELVPVGDVHHLEELADIMGLELSYLRMKYLGLPLGAKFKAKIIRNTILEKMERRQAGRKWLYLLKWS